MNDFALWNEEVARDVLDTFTGHGIDWGDDPLAATHLCEEWADKMRRRRRFRSGPWNFGEQP